MPKKTKLQKRHEAELRAIHYTWENSKAKRLGTCTEAEWKARQA